MILVAAMFLSEKVMSEEKVIFVFPAREEERE